MKTSILVKVRSKPGEEGCRLGERRPTGLTIIICFYPQVASSAGHCFQNTIQGPRMQVLALGVLGPVLGGKGRVEPPQG